MPRDRWDRKANKLSKRDWENLCDSWLNFAILGGIAGTPPECGLGELASLRKELSEIVGDQPKDLQDNIDGLRESVLKEGIFQLQKAAHILNGAQIHIDRGMASWSLSSAYHAGFSAANGILNLLGIVFVEADGPNFLIDVWSEPPKKQRSKLKPLNTIRLQRIPGLPAQRNVWQVFQRMLRVTTFDTDIISQNWRTALLNLEKKDFSRKRNQVYYRNSNWPYDDVREFVTANDFRFDKIDLLDGSLISDPEHNGFPLALAFVLIRIGHQMLKSLVTMSSLLKPELDAFYRWLDGDNNVLYQDALAGIAQGET